MFSGTSRTRNNEHEQERRVREIAENLKEFFPDADLEEVIARQESAYYYMQGNKAGHSSTSSQSRNANGSRGGASFDSQLAMDEALARSLAELPDDFDGLGMTNHSHHNAVTDRSRPVSGIRDTPPRGTSSRIASQTSSDDDINPDTMTYEELQSLGDNVGHESKGVPKHLISRLPTYKFKCGFFSKKKKDECVICYSQYKNGVNITTLPCAHQYHSQCINRWLHENKTCPVCKKEVGED